MSKPNSTPVEGVVSTPEPTAPVVDGQGNLLERPGSAYPGLEDFKCPVCLETFIDTVETDCHHRFCDFCLKQWFRTRGNRFCPVCRSHITSVQLLEDISANVEAQLVACMTPQQIEERITTKRRRESALIHFQQNPVVDNPDNEESEEYSQMRDDFLSVSEEEDSWQFELEVDNPFSRTRSRGHPYMLYQSHYDIEFDYNISGLESSREQSPSRSYMHPRRASPFPAHRFNYSQTQDGNFSDDSDARERFRRTTGRMSDLNAYLSDTSLQAHALNRDNSDENRNSTGAHRTSESLEDLRSLRETIRIAEATVGAGSFGDDSPSDDPGPYFSQSSARVMERHPTPSRRNPNQTMIIGNDHGGLLEEFHHQFHLTENAFEAMLAAQHELDNQGNILRSIYHRCLDARLLGEYRDPGVFERVGRAGEHLARSYGSMRSPGYTEYLQHTLDGINSGSQEQTHSEGVHSPYYQSIWSTYLGPNFDSDHQPPWYQRCMNAHSHSPGPSAQSTQPPMEQQQPQFYFDDRDTSTENYPGNELNFTRHNFDTPSSSTNVCPRYRLNLDRCRQQRDEDADTEHFWEMRGRGLRQRLGRDTSIDFQDLEDDLQEAIRRSTVESADSSDSDGMADHHNHNHTQSSTATATILQENQGHGVTITRVGPQVQIDIESDFLTDIEADEMDRLEEEGESRVVNVEVEISGIQFHYA